MRAAALLVTCAALAAACVRDPETSACPDASEGDLVVTEVGGPQTGQDTLQPWIELYNASNHSIDLLGLKIRFRNPSGSSEDDTIVRRSLSVAPGNYAVIGLDDDTMLPSYIDYGMTADFHASWPSSAAIDVEACGTRIDLAQYSSLPKTGTYSLGAHPPTAEANDLPAMWCTDTTVNAGSFPGTPKRANTACP